MATTRPRLGGGEAVRRFESQDIRTFVSRRLAGEPRSPSNTRDYPRLSIVTPSFNQAQFLERTILSVLNQNYPHLEFIIIDGGSTDGSVEIIKKYEPWLAYWISERDAGQGDALNKGFQRANGELVGWQNSDDIYLPGTFGEVGRIFLDHPALDVVFANRLDVDERDNVIGESRFAPFSAVGHWYDGMSLSNQSTFWRRELFSKIGMIDASYHLAMDYEFFLRAAQKRARFRHVRRYWGASRKHASSKENTLFATQMRPEWDRIDSVYGKSRWVVPLRTYALVRRGLHYLWQGDWDYAFRGLRRRGLQLIERLGLRSS